ncbi:MAG: hypothetical protein D4R84_06020 [Rhodocyclaceae bacterium]|nr:MAG: hypothetical protein D4R84_06020 [Rhodocyclaceae bacterium]
MKTLAPSLLVLAALIGGTVFLRPGNLNPLLDASIAHRGSMMARARVSVDEVNIAPSSGRGTINNLVIGNPAGFKSAYAVKADRIDLEVDLASVNQDIVVIRFLVIDGPEVLYQQGDAMTNFDAIQKNIVSYLGGVELGMGAHGKRLIIEELTIYNTRAQASAGFMNNRNVSVALPDISLKNIGKTKGGVTPGELVQEVFGALNAKLGTAANFDRLKMSAGQSLDKAGQRTAM